MITVNAKAKSNYLCIRLVDILAQKLSGIFSLLCKCQDSNKNKMNNVFT